MNCSSKYDMRNFVNFYPTSQRFQNFTSMGYFCPKYMRFELKNMEELSFMKLNGDAKFEQTLPDLMVSKMAWGIGWTFNRALKNLKNCTLMGSFCPKSYVSARKLQRDYVSWHWRVMQNLKKKRLVVWKIT